MDPEQGRLRIGELSRRVGVSEQALRAWESRYGLLRPARTEGGYRLYSDADETRVRRMQAHLAAGLAASQAARAALAEEPGGSLAAESAETPPRQAGVDSGDGLRRALDRLDEPAAQAELDRLLTDFTVQAVLRDVLLPYLHDLGERWEAGEISVAKEHFASNVIRGRLAGLARGWGNGGGHQALLACPPGELHDLPVLVFGIALNRQGWRIRYLGADTPMRDTIALTTETRPSIVVLAATTPEHFTAVGPELEQLAALAPLVIAGAGATDELAQRIGAQRVTADAVTAAEHLAGSIR